MRVAPLLLLAACAVDDPSDPGDSSAPTGTSPEDPSPPPAVYVYASVAPETPPESTFECEYDEASCPTDCAANSPPTLSEPEIWINGAPDDGTVTPASGDTIVVAFAYSDADDNLRCGSYTRSIQDYGYEADSGGSLCSNLPADSASGGLPLGALFQLAGPGTYSIALTLHDACDGSSERREWSLTL